MKKALLGTVACVAALSISGTAFAGKDLDAIKARGSLVCGVGTGTAGYAGDGHNAAQGQLNTPHEIRFNKAGDLFIADTENHCIRRYDPASGTIALVAGMPARSGPAVGADLLSTQLARPHGCCIDPQGRLVIADSDNDRILAGDVPAGTGR